MDVRLSHEQQDLQESVAQVVKGLGPQTVQQLDDTERAAKLDAAVAGSGWRELRMADDDGQPWASVVEVALIAEELARGVADVSFVGPTLAAELRRMAKVAPATAAETVALVPELGSLAAGSSGVAIDAAGSASALVLSDGALAEVAVSGADVGADLTRPSRALSASPSPLGGAALTADDLHRWTSLGLAIACADLVGTMRGGIQLATDYASARKQYGVHVGSFQAVQHMLADAFVLMEGSRSVALHAAWAVDALSPSDALGAAALAKAYCGRAARDVCETVIQVHGGIGNTWECLAHVYLRRALLSIDLLGGVDASLARVLAHRGIGGADGLR